MGDEEFFAGELLMLTKNLALLDLYNGDSGIVIDMKIDEKKFIKYLMVKKKAKKSDLENEKDSSEQGGIFRKGDYIFYPINLLPREAIETAYAITIHKSQGSGYKAILVFFPEQIGHPLLNRQIVYTAITRTEGSTYIVATKETIEHAKKTIIERDTMIGF